MVDLVLVELVEGLGFKCEFVSYVWGVWRGAVDSNNNYFGFFKVVGGCVEFVIANGDVARLSLCDPGFVDLFVGWFDR